MDIKKEWYMQELKKGDEALLHRPMEEECSFYEAVSEGNMDYVRRNCEDETFTDMNGVGILSTNPITNIKYHFVITTAIVTRLCVTKGMELEQAYRLSDFYILKLDSMNTLEAVSQLHHTMVLDFTGKMLLLRKQHIISKPVVQCVDYIYSHLNMKITLQDLAGHTGLSPSYLSRLFKKELGVSIRDYILEKKIEKAKNLLKYSDCSLIDIANYLAFSSQSHLIQTFRHKVGITPSKYRNHHYRSNW